MTSFEAIILCGGSAKRMKPFLPFNKALAEIIPGQTMLRYQINWLKQNKAQQITLAINQETYNTVEEKDPDILDEVNCSIEKEKLGTGGAVKKAVETISSSKFYLMNIDDIIASKTYTANQLVEKINKTIHCVILLSRTRFPFGIVETEGPYITRFKQKPILEYWINTGHYALTRESVQNYFPDRGNFEDDILPQMAEKRQLSHQKLEGDWFAVNNIKQLEEAKEKLEQMK